MVTRALFTVLALAAVLLLHPTRGEALPTIEAGTPISLTTDTFVVPIQITGAVELITWQFDLAFDPSVVQINTGCDTSGADPYCDLFNGPVTEGPFTKGPFSLFVPGVIDNFGGSLTIVAGGFGDPPPGPTGDGILAYVEFITIDANGDPDIHVTSSSVTSSAVPEPMSLLLLAGGLTFLGARRRFGKSEQH